MRAFAVKRNHLAILAIYFFPCIDLLMLQVGSRCGGAAHATSYNTPAHSSLRTWVASPYALKGETGRAAVELAEARRLSGGNRFSSIAHVKEWYWTPAIGGLLETTFLAGLRKAGMPEE
jgi:hypothetical protein